MTDTRVITSLTSIAKSLQIIAGYVQRLDDRSQSFADVPKFKPLREDRRWE